MTVRPGVYAIRNCAHAKSYLTPHHSSGRAGTRLYAEHWLNEGLQKVRYSQLESSVLFPHCFNISGMFNITPEVEPMSLKTLGTLGCSSRLLIPAAERCLTPKSIRMWKNGLFMKPLAGMVSSEFLDLVNVSDIFTDAALSASSKLASRIKSLKLNLADSR